MFRDPIVVEASLKEELDKLTPEEFQRALAMGLKMAVHTKIVMQHRYSDGEPRPVRIKYVDKKDKMDLIQYIHDNENKWGK